MDLDGVGFVFGDVWQLEVSLKEWILQIFFCAKYGLSYE